MKAYRRIKDWKYFLILILICIVLGTETTYSDEEGSGIQGKEFILTFLPNYHNLKFTNPMTSQDSLYIFITSAVPTQGKIIYYDINGFEYTENFVIPDADYIYVFRKFFNNFELLGLNDSGRIEFSNGQFTNTNQCEIIARQSFRVIADDEVTVFAHSESMMTSEAFSVLPVTALGQHYFVMAYNTHTTGTFFAADNSSNTPSQFAIVAPYDDTEITIIPSVETVVNKGSVQNIILNAGDVYLVQANISSSQRDGDLTGSEITSSKPIAVFGGQQRTALPNQITTQGSRDILIEQIPPVNSWGTNALITTFPQPPEIHTHQYDDIIRVLAAFDDTNILINENLHSVINKGEYAEIAVKSPMKVRANAPILVAQFKKSGQTFNSPPANSDPFMIILPPIEQFGNYYRFSNIQAYSNSSKAYNFQYINVMAPDEAIGDVKLDDVVINPVLFRSIPQSGYSFATIPITDGPHTVHSRYNIGVLAYGYGIATSYGYFAGMSFKKIDVNPPKILSDIECYKASFVITDTLENDSGLSNVRARETTKVNMSVSVPQFQYAQPIVKITAELDDYRFDGYADIVATDTSGLESYYKLEIPGFTVAFLQSGADIFIEDELLLFREHCFTYNLINYGKFPQTVNEIKFSDYEDIFRTKIDSSFTIQPGQIIPIEVCITPDEIKQYLNTMHILDDCGERSVAVFDIFGLYDIEPPRVTEITDDCYENIDLFIVDSLRSDFGLKKIEILREENCQLTQIKYNRDIAIFKVEILDYFQDTYYTIEATDSAGLTTIHHGEFPGYTLDIFIAGSAGEENMEVDFETITIGDFVCKKVKFDNYGAFPITFEELMLKYNIYFSIPNHQLPLEIPPHSSKELDICFTHYYVTNPFETDSIFFTYNCIDRVISLKGVTKAKRFETERCDIPIYLESSEVPNSFYLGKLYPNPATYTGTINYGVSEKVQVKMQLTDLLGISNKTIFDETLEAGYYETEILFENIPSGVYFLTIQAGNEIKREKVIIE